MKHWITAAALLALIAEPSGVVRRLLTADGLDPDALATDLADAPGEPDAVDLRDADLEHHQEGHREHQQQEHHRKEGEDGVERQRSRQAGAAAASKGVEHVGEKCEFSHADPRDSGAVRSDGWLGSLRRAGHGTAARASGIKAPDKGA